VLNPGIATALRAWTNIQNTDYNIDELHQQRQQPFLDKDAIQPRLGFSYDLFGDQRHVIFGGAGRAYDRNMFDYMAREFYGARSPPYTSTSRRQCIRAAVAGRHACRGIRR
jgi:hypothetical protein